MANIWVLEHGKSVYSAALEWIFECRINTPSYLLFQHCVAAPLAVPLSRLPLWSRTSTPSFPQPLPLVRAAWTPTLCYLPSLTGPAPTTSGQTSMGRLTQVCRQTVSKLDLLGVWVMQQWWEGLERTWVYRHVNTENMHAHAHMHSHTQVYIWMHAYTHMHAPMHTHAWCMHECMHTHVRTHTRMHACMRAHARTHAHKTIAQTHLKSKQMQQKVSP